MTDIFEHTVLCKNCNTKMIPCSLNKDNFQLRALKCEKCNEKIIHPEDLKEYEDFQNIRKKHYRVKLRFVGNSYAVSIPRELINFMNEQEEKMKQIVDLCLEEADKISLNFKL
jgi:hypothetical protein